MPDIPPVHLDAAAVDLVEAHEEVDERRLPAAGGADDRGGLPRLYQDREILKKRLCLIIAEKDVGDPDLPPRLRELLRVLRIRQNPRLVHELKDAGGRGERILKLCNHGGDIVEGLCVLCGIAQSRAELSDSERPLNRKDGPRHPDKGIDQGIDKAGRGIHEGAEKGRPHGVAGELLIDLGKALRALSLPGKGLHHL